MNAEILAVGTELLMGQIANTNAQYISKRLSEIGVNVYFHSVVGDNSKRLKDSLLLSLGRSDTVIMTGGLGPTKDDLTKETVAETFGLKLAKDDYTLEVIENFFSKIGRPMTENNIKQAFFPEGCIIVRNKNGTAPGCIIEKNGKIVIMLPGPPSEMIPMFSDSILPYLREKSGSMLKSIYLKIFGVGESRVETIISDLMDIQINPTIAPYAKEGEVTLRITAGAMSDREADELIAPVVNEIKNRIGDSVYAEEDINLEEVTAKLLLDKKKTIAVAESCTGGLISGRFTDKAGISEVFNRGVVCYSNESKIDLLGVKEDTLKAFGAVSEETAREMAEGIKRKSGTDIGLSVTGIAGPGGGTDAKPVGLVYIGISSDNGACVKRLTLTGSRARIRNLSAMHAFDMVRRHLLGLNII